MAAYFKDMISSGGMDYMNSPATKRINSKQLKGLNRLLKLVRRRGNLPDTEQVLTNIIDNGYYTESQQQFLNNLRILYNKPKIGKKGYFPDPPNSRGALDASSTQTEAINVNPFNAIVDNDYSEVADTEYNYKERLTDRSTEVSVDEIRNLLSGKQVRDPYKNHSVTLPQMDWEFDTPLEEKYTEKLTVDKPVTKHMDTIIRSEITRKYGTTDIKTVDNSWYFTPVTKVNEKVKLPHFYSNNILDLTNKVVIYLTKDLPIKQISGKLLKKLGTLKEAIKDLLTE